MPKLTIDNANVEVLGHHTCERRAHGGESDPSLCYLEGVRSSVAAVYGLVEVEGAPRTLSASCSLPVAEGMKVRTNTPK